MPLDRCSGGVMSAMYAEATEMFAPHAPANTRDRTISPSAVLAGSSADEAIANSA
jgi:hypothetical protein